MTVYAVFIDLYLVVVTCTCLKKRILNVGCLGAIAQGGIVPDTM